MKPEDLEEIGTRVLTVRDLWAMASEAQTLFGPFARLKLRRGMGSLKYTVLRNDGTAAGVIRVGDRYSLSKFKDPDE